MRTVYMPISSAHIMTSTPSRPAEKTLEILCRFFVAEYRISQRNKDQIAEYYRRRRRPVDILSYDVETGRQLMCDKAIDKLCQLGLPESVLEQIWNDEREAMT